MGLFGETTSSSCVTVVAHTAKNITTSNIKKKYYHLLSTPSWPFTVTPQIISYFNVFPNTLVNLRLGSTGDGLIFEVSITLLCVNFIAKLSKKCIPLYTVVHNTVG